MTYDYTLASFVADTFDIGAFIDGLPRDMRAQQAFVKLRDLPVKLRDPRETNPLTKQRTFFEGNYPRKVYREDGVPLFSLHMTGVRGPRKPTLIITFLEDALPYLT